MILRSLQGESKNESISIMHVIVGIPKVFWYGEEAGSNVLVMELLDKNVEEMFSE